MDDTDPAKLEAALERLKAEQARRLQAKIDSGEVVSVQTVVVIHPDEDEEEATARALAKHPVPDDGRAVHRELFFVFTGVPRDPDFGQWEPSPQVQTVSEEEPSRPSEEPAANGPPIPHSQPEYIFVTTRQATDAGDPGQIAEALWSVNDGCVVLTDLEGRHLTSRALLKGQDPAAVARALLREAEEPKRLGRPIRYPKLGLA
jgi:hypothetical protein